MKTDRSMTQLKHRPDTSVYAGVSMDTLYFYPVFSLFRKRKLLVPSRGTKIALSSASQNKISLKPSEQDQNVE